ncbi:DUF1697 domain-containing protein [Clostridium sp. 'White wine YQ']|uniref:DUF1697 domain-containing protein n=1 Tax=Clostridium sp. 'White wine YQ' TaxID=3027474 RepID=UPI002365969A|nr:DUF1697 domain-containing protein [Clostridium sp. 'White wine YQ']MDD7794288.1 DUF1697 domain-containing protein [Clostridium sp. 'White wine YQ']
MTTFIALLRGINVGGKNIIKMAELKKALESIGLLEVKTYIQSGNVLFKSSEDKKIIKEKIEREIEKTFKISLTVVLRTSTELEDIINNCPFSDEQIKDAESHSDSECLYVALLTDSPLQENVEKLKSYKSENDEYSIIGRDVYLLFKNSIRNSKLANNLHKLDVPATVRNWKTISKLVALSKEMNT